MSTPKTPKPPATVEHVKKLLLLASTQRRPYIIVVFQGGTVTPLGLLQELHTRSVLVRIPTSKTKTPKPPATVEHVKKLLLLATTQRRPYIIVVFQGGTVTPLGLLQELHTRSALVRIPICLPGGTKDGHRPRVSCCPFCAYTIQNDPAYLNHIICTHYDVNFACGACLSAITSSGQQMKNHIKECSGLAPPPTASQESAPVGICLKRVLLAPNMCKAKRKATVPRNPVAARWTGTGPMPLLCFAVIESALMSARTSRVSGSMDAGPRCYVVVLRHVLTS